MAPEFRQGRGSDPELWTSFDEEFGDAFEIELFFKEKRIEQFNDEAVTEEAKITI